MKIAVVGGGIIGSTCAYQALKSKLPIQELHIYADKFTSETTSTGAAGLWRAAKVANTPREKIDRWAKASLDYGINILSYDADASAKGFAPTHGFLLSRKPLPDKVWRHYGISFVELTDVDIRRRFPNVDKDLKYGISFSSYTLESDRYLPFLKKEIEKMGGVFIKRRVNSLHDISQNYDVIINCSGLGARELVNDKKVFPVRGQILYVKAPWIKEFVYDIDVIDGKVPYIIPNIDRVILGGTKQDNSYSLEVSQETRQWILENTKKLIPSIEKAEIMNDWVGLRPGRDEIRLEAEKLSAPINGMPNREIMVIHNYGHGANGITLSWGCAENAIEILTEHARTSAFSRL